MCSILLSMFRVHLPLYMSLIQLLFITYQHLDDIELFRARFIYTLLGSHFCAVHNSEAVLLQDLCTSLALIANTAAIFTIMFILRSSRFRYLTL
jgi:hypothetical protein